MRIQRKHSWLGAGLGVALAAAGAGWFFWQSPAGADPGNPAQVALGRGVYDRHCAACHGDRLQGEPDWQRRKANGRLPAPPHDASGHTWHHADGQLFGIVKNGLGPYVPAEYESDMQGFGSVLSDAEIWAVLAYIKSSWPEDIRERQRQFSARAAE
jgi:mono/diheme cytochrome c family protein